MRSNHFSRLILLYLASKGHVCPYMGITSLSLPIYPMKQCTDMDVISAMVLVYTMLLPALECLDSYLIIEKWS